MNIHRAWCGTLCAVLALSLCACGADPPPPPKPRPPTANAANTSKPSLPAPRPIPKAGSLPGDIARLITIANEDFAAQRFVSPPTANALEGFLEVRDLDPDNGSVREAMVDLYPLATAAVRAAIDARDLAEAERILGLVERGMPGALGVAELRSELDGLKAAGTDTEGSAAAPAAATAADDGLAPSGAAVVETSIAVEAGAPAVEAAPASSPADPRTGDVPPP